MWKVLATGIIVTVKSVGVMKMEVIKTMRIDSRTMFNGFRDDVNPVVRSLERQVARHRDCHTTNAASHIEHLIIWLEPTNFNKVLKQFLSYNVEITPRELIRANVHQASRRYERVSSAKKHLSSIKYEPHPGLDDAKDTLHDSVNFRITP